MNLKKFYNLEAKNILEINKINPKLLILNLKFL